MATGVPTVARLQELVTAQRFIAAVKEASLEQDCPYPDVLYSLRHPPCTRVTDHLEDVHLRFALDIFLDLNTSSNDAYTSVRQSYLRAHPAASIPSHYQMKRRIVELTGIAPVKTDMCPRSCLAYTGPFAAYDRCPECQEPRFDASALPAKVPQRVFYTLLLGPQLQTQWRSPEGAHNMRLRNSKFQCDC